MPDVQETAFRNRDSVLMALDREYITSVAVQPMIARVQGEFELALGLVDLLPGRCWVKHAQEREAEGRWGQVVQLDIPAVARWRRMQPSADGCCRHRRLYRRTDVRRGCR